MRMFVRVELGIEACIITVIVGHPPYTCKMVL